jgi:predicted TIM-barrel fold metal-dependent hydrolase
MLIDAHSHIFPQVRGLVADGPTRGLGYGRIAVGGNEEQLMPPYNEKTIYTPEMLLANMDWAGVDKAMLLQGTFYGDWNPYVGEALEKYPERLIGAAFLDPWHPQAQSYFDELIQQDRFRAVKLECSEKTGLCGLHPDAHLDDPELDWLWRELAARQKVLVLDLGAIGSRSYQSNAVRSIAQDYPKLPIVIAHLAQPNPRAEAKLPMWRLWLAQIKLGRLPNVFFDTAALPAYMTDEDFPYPSAARYLKTAVELIGPAKIMWGSDQPGLLGVLNYPQLVRLGRLHTQFMTPREQAMVLGENAARVYS